MTDVLFTYGDYAHILKLEENGAVSQVILTSDHSGGGGNFLFISTGSVQEAAVDIDKNLLFVVEIFRSAGTIWQLWKLTPPDTVTVLDAAIPNNPQSTTTRVDSSGRVIVGIPQPTGNDTARFRRYSSLGVLNTDWSVNYPHPPGTFVDVLYTDVSPDGDTGYVFLAIAYTDGITPTVYNIYAVNLNTGVNSLLFTAGWPVIGNELYNSIAIVPFTVLHPSGDIILAFTEDARNLSSLAEIWRYNSAGTLMQIYHPGITIPANLGTISDEDGYLWLEYDFNIGGQVKYGKLNLSSGIFTFQFALTFFQSGSTPANTSYGGSNPFLTGYKIAEAARFFMNVTLVGAT